MAVSLVSKVLGTKGLSGEMWAGLNEKVLLKASNGDLRR